MDYEIAIIDFAGCGTGCGKSDISLFLKLETELRLRLERLYFAQSIWSFFCLDPKYCFSYSHMEPFIHETYLDWLSFATMERGKGSELNIPQKKARCIEDLLESIRCHEVRFGASKCDRLMFGGECSLAFVGSLRRGYLFLLLPRYCLRLFESELPLLQASANYERPFLQKVGGQASARDFLGLTCRHSPRKICKTAQDVGKVRDVTRGHQICWTIAQLCTKLLEINSILLTKGHKRIKDHAYKRWGASNSPCKVKLEFSSRKSFTFLKWMGSGLTDMQSWADRIRNRFDDLMRSGVKKWIIGKDCWQMKKTGWIISRNFQERGKADVLGSKVVSTTSCIANCRSFSPNLTLTI